MTNDTESTNDEMYMAKMTMDEVGADIEAHGHVSVTDENRTQDPFTNKGALANALDEALDSLSFTRQTGTDSPEFEAYSEYISANIGQFTEFNEHFGYCLLDVDADAQLEARWDEHVPVLLAGDGAEICRHRLDEAALRAWAAEARA